MKIIEIFNEEERKDIEQLIVFLKLEGFNYERKVSYKEHDYELDAKRWFYSYTYLGKKGKLIFRFFIYEDKFEESYSEIEADIDGCYFISMEFREIKEMIDWILSII